MNKSDLKLILGLFIVIFSIFAYMFFTKNNKPNNALVYYKDNLLLTIDLNTSGIKEYTVQGELGDVVIEKNNDKIRVVTETSPNHICSKQGYIKESYEVITCLPNKIVIKIESIPDVDTVVE